METHTHSRTTISIQLDQSEEWLEFDDKERPFYVQHVYLSVEGDERTRDQKAALRGLLIRADGSRGYLNRTVAKPVLDLPFEVAEKIFEKVNASRAKHGFKQDKVY